MKMSQFRPVLQRNLSKHNRNLHVKKPGARIKLTFQEISKRHAKAQTAMDFQPHKTTY